MTTKDYLTECIEELKNISKEEYNKIKSSKQLNFKEAYYPTYNLPLTATEHGYLDELIHSEIDRFSDNKEVMGLLNSLSKKLNKISREILEADGIE